MLVKRFWSYLSSFARYGVFVTIIAYFVSGFVFAGEEFALSENLLETVKNDFGRSAKRRLEEWRDFINKTKHRTDLSDRDKLELVNDFFNENIEFLDDIDHWGKEDYWATPVETLVTEGGDCEDFSIAKYFTLKEIGVPIRKMLLTYVKALDLDQAHMVLTYYDKPSSEPLVLDNLIDEIEPASERDDLAPVYSFNGRGLWLAKQRGLGKRVGGSGRISLWTELGDRMKKEGFKK